MSLSSLKSRLLAGGIHLLLSAAVALLACGLIFLVWYPGPLARMEGVNQLVLLMIAVDVVIGPLITALVFVRGKPGLRFDLTVIAIVQVAALAYGLHTIYLGRPAYVVFNVDRFDVVSAADVSMPSLQRARDKGRPGLPRLGPETVAARLPDDPDLRSSILFEAAAGGADLPQSPEWYLPYSDERSAVLEHLRPLDELRTVNEMDDEAWQAFVESLGKTEQSLGYLPLRGKARDGAVIVEAETADIVVTSLLVPRWD